MAVEYVDHLEPGWFVLDVMQAKAREQKWLALMIDVDPDELKNCICDVPALFYVRPIDHFPGDRTVSQRWFRIPGRRRNKVIAREALENMATEVVEESAFPRNERNRGSDPRLLCQTTD
jgi:hypothetical protein